MHLKGNFELKNLPFFIKRLGRYWNYVITGSIGHISKPIVQQLTAAGHHVSVVTSNQDRVKDIEALRAKALVGSVEDAAFVTRSFAHADAVYISSYHCIKPYTALIAGNYIAYNSGIGCQKTIRSKLWQ